MKSKKEILNRYTSGKSSEAEKAFVEQWYYQFNQNKDITDKDVDRIVHSLDDKMGIKPNRSKRLFWYTAASVAAALCVFGFVFFQDKLTPTDTHEKLIYAPTEANAFVVLKNNKEFDLNKLDINDTLETEDFYITRLNDGSIKYLPSDDNRSSATQYNTLITKGGATASLTLSDGSRVWVNANSKLTYPIVFKEGLREVQLEGEGYFEIEKKRINGKTTPFIVRGKDRTIQVVGTKFNLDFYNKDTEIALLEGRINVAAQGSTLEDKNQIHYKVSMLPNQLLKADKLSSENNIERHIDWKEGYFNLNGIQLLELTRELSDWYGARIEVEKSLLTHEMYGRISREKSLNEVLNLLKRVAPITYKISEKNITITKVNN